MIYGETIKLSNAAEENCILAKRSRKYGVDIIGYQGPLFAVTKVILRFNLNTLISFS